MKTGLLWSSGMGREDFYVQSITSLSRLTCELSTLQFLPDLLPPTQLTAPGSPSMRALRLWRWKTGGFKAHRKSFLLRSIVWNYHKPSRTWPLVFVAKSTRKYDHISPLSKKLNWLPVSTQQIKVLLSSSLSAWQAEWQRISHLDSSGEEKQAGVSP